jgi:hypothetical protein
MLLMELITTVKLSNQYWVFYISISAQHYTTIRIADL